MKKHPSFEKPFPWKQILIGVGLVFLTGLVYLMQQYSAFFAGSIVGTPKYVLDGYSCPPSSFAFDVSPIPALFSYTKGNAEANRKEMARINKKNHGLTAWFTYDMGFNEGLKAKLIDAITYEKNPDQYVATIYNAISGHKTLHGAGDFVTKWLAPDNINMPTVFPYTAGTVVEAQVKSGYGNMVSVCTDLVNGSQKLRVLYTVAHLDSISVTPGQVLKAGDEIGKIGTTGSSTTPHAHVSIHPDLVWVPNYSQVYNAGYKSYYPTSVSEILVKMIDPISVMLNPEIAYSIVLNDQKRQQVFNNASQYVASVSNSNVAFDGGLLIDGSASIITPPAEAQKVFTDFRITPDLNQAKAGNSVNVIVEAIDQDGNLFSGFSESIDVVLSSSTAQFSGVKALQNGRTTFQISDPNPGEVVIQVSNKGTISEEKKVVFTDYLKFLEITAPQKTTVNTNVAVGIRPVGTKGGVVTDALNVSVTVFPSIVGDSSVLLSNGRGEYLFKADKEGIYELAFRTEGVSEKVQISVQKTEALVSTETIVEVEGTEGTNGTEGTEDAEGAEGTNDAGGTEGEDETSETESDNETSHSGVEGEVSPCNGSGGCVDEGAKPSAAPPIVLLEGANYRIYEIDGMTTIVFNDKDVTTEYPVEMKFDVPDGTEAVSIFSGLNDRNFPDTGELKLSKYTPGQKTVRYYPKYVPEDTYKKIVTYKAGVETSSKIFTWSPASVHAFTDVVDGVTDPEIYKAVKQLKLAGVVKGNPDGSYGVETPINRASTATLLIRAFYSDVNLDALQVSSLAFKDVPKTAWYASAIWFASQAEYKGESKPVIIKGFDGKANPDGNVKLEEFVTMLLRLLEIPTETTEPWYEGAIAKSIQLGFISEAERKYIDKPLERGLVARIMVKALESLQNGSLEQYQVRKGVEGVEGTNGTNGTEGMEGTEGTEEGAGLTGSGQAPGTEDLDALGFEVEAEEVDGTGGLEEDEAEVLAARDIKYEFSGSGLSLSWESDFSGTFTIYRETVGGNGEIVIGTTGGTAFSDVSAKAGKQYYYRIGFPGVKKAEILVNL
ncbi:MAG: peptidoglycan DD-metalloendopeptidase family protein [Candidatus Altimarinota bacterium]